MLHHTRGIVFKVTDYAESSIVVQVLTQKFGLQSFLVNGVKRPKARIKQNVFQPLNLLDMVVYYKPGGNIHRVSEVRADPVFQTIPYEIRKSSIALFLNKVLYKTVKQQTEDEELFNFIFHAIELFDKIQEGVSNFHLFFLLRLTKYLGFYPDIVTSSGVYFDLNEGVLTNVLPKHPLVIRPPETEYWINILESKFERIGDLKFTGEKRKLLLQYVLDYYQIHIESFTGVKSLDILEEVLH